MTPDSPRRSGFSLIELLVVIAIIGVLAALLMVAIQSTRESARRTQCMNNLKQIGLALASYHDLHNALPPGYISAYDSYLRRDIGPGWGWGTAILPHLEQQPLYNQIQLNLPIQDPSNQTVRTRPLQVFLCPSDNMPPTWTASQGETWIYAGQIYSALLPICDVASANYVGVFGIAEPGVDGEGVFFRDSFIGQRDISDGMSSTFAVGERSTNLNSGRGQATWTGTVVGADFWSCTPNPYDPDGGICRHEDGSGMIMGHTGEGHGPGDPNGDVNQFLSKHGRAAHFLYCDGHVQLIQGAIDYPTYKALSTRAGGEILNAY
jgi:prepilin-type N-terminal cleavage/methylation domain-containing protein/prepilin-type processing-associated H-X9-DG protein